METIIAIFLGIYLIVIGVISYIRVSKDFKEGKK